MKTTTLLTVTLIAVAPMVGCATIVDGTTRSVTITSRPAGADVTVLNSGGRMVFSGKTPTVVELKRGKGYFQGENYIVKFAKAGCQPTQVPITKNVNGWYFGNILLGGLVGMLIVDPLTGAMWTLDNNICADLSPLPSAFNAEGSLNVVCLNDVAEDLRKHLHAVK